MNYGKIENGGVTLLDQNDPNAFPIVTIDSPNEKAPEGYFWECGWEQKDDHIQMIWYLEKNADTAEELLSILTGEAE